MAAVRKLRCSDHTSGGRQHRAVASTKLTEAGKDIERCNSSRSQALRLLKDTYCGFCFCADNTIDRSNVVATCSEGTLNSEPVIFG